MRTLILVPTDIERRVIEPIVAPALGSTGILERCGFGPVAAAARTALLVERHHPDRVVLVGIAGRLADQLAIAAAYRFDQVACFGIGIGSGEEFRPAGAVEWPQWPGDAGDGSPPIGDLIGCRPAGPATPGAGLLLTACAASATPDDVRLRKRWFPAAAAEDQRRIRIRVGWTCSDYVRNEHRWRWQAYACGAAQWCLIRAWEWIAKEKKVNRGPTAIGEARADNASPPQNQTL